MKNRDNLQRLYQTYLELITGQCELAKSPLVSMVQTENKNALPIYQSDYLHGLILNWSGVIEEIFSNTCRILKQENINLRRFVPFFYQTPLPMDNRYDFFLIKLDRFREFVRDAGNTLEPGIKEELLATTEREYASCRDAYLSFNSLD